MQPRNPLRVVSPTCERAHVRTQIIGLLTAIILSAGIFMYNSPTSLAAPGDETTYYFLNDHLGSVDTVLDDKGNIVEQRDFLPFGSERVTNEDGVVKNTSHKFTGKELDEETGLYYYGARYYDPVIGRFTTTDPLVTDMNNIPSKKMNAFLSDPQNLNAYSYAGNNPLRFFDPFGFWKKETGEVEKGDSLSAIVGTINKLFDTAYKISEIASLNNIKDPDKIYAGDKIMPNLDVPDITKSLQNEMKTWGSVMEGVKTETVPDKISALIYFGEFSTDPDKGNLKSRKESVFNTNEQGTEGYVYSAEKIEYDAPANMLYGYAAKALGLSAFGTYMPAGLYQIFSGTSDSSWSFSWPNYGDDPSDNFYIRKGEALYEKK